jgi:hypothetical protein
VRPSESVYGTNTTVLDTPRSVSQVSAQQLRNDVIRTADDLVKYAPGVTRGGGQNVNVAPQIRGQNSELFQDGQRIYNVRHPTNLNAYEGADIVAGVSSVVFGPVTSSGGYVNYIPKRPHFDKAETEFSGLFGALVPGGGSYPSNRITIDTNNPIGDQFAYRVSVTLQRAGDYYEHIQNNYNAFYGAIAWQPSSRFRLDVNASYDDYYDYNVTHGWNRLTQRLVDTYGKEYNAGRATPIIETPGVGLWSPVFASGAPDSEVIGWQTREKNAEGKFVATGPVNTSALPNATPQTPGTIRGWVYDPNLRGNDVKSISPRTSARAEDKNTSSRLQTQARATFDISDDLKLVNRLLFSHARDSTNSVGSFLTQSRDAILDDRFELVNHSTHRPFGVELTHDSNSGVSFRHEDFYSLAANNSFNINPYDLTQNSSDKNPGGLLGIPVTGATGSWVGQAGVPQQSAFGYLNLAPMWPVQNGLYAERGGSPPAASYTSQGWWNTWTLFTQHSFLLSKRFGVNAGLSKSYVRAHIENPLIITAADEVRDEQSFSLNSLQVSPLVKITKNSTIYFTYDRSVSFNTGGFANVLTWGPGNKLNPLAFESVSKLYEGGIKAELIPEHLFASAAVYYQARDTSPDINGNMARLETKGAEASLRYQEDLGVRAGLNLSWIAPRFTFIIPAGFSPYGFQPDDETVFGDRNVLNQRQGTEYDAAGIPNYSATGFVGYQFPIGFGAELAGWLTSPWFTDISENVKVPTQANLDLTVYYRVPQWDAAITVTNLTDANNFVNGLAGSSTEFLQPMRPLTLQAKLAYRL